MNLETIILVTIVFNKVINFFQFFQIPLVLALTLAIFRKIVLNKKVVFFSMLVIVFVLRIPLSFIYPALAKWLGMEVYLLQKYDPIGILLPVIIFAVFLYYPKNKFPRLLDTRSENQTFINRRMLLVGGVSASLVLILAVQGFTRNETKNSYSSIIFEAVTELSVKSDSPMFYDNSGFTYFNILKQNKTREDGSWQGKLGALIEVSNVKFRRNAKFYHDKGYIVGRYVDFTAVFEKGKKRGAILIADTEPRISVYSYQIK